MGWRGGQEGEEREGRRGSGGVMRRSGGVREVGVEREVGGKVRGEVK